MERKETFNESRRNKKCISAILAAGIFTAALPLFSISACAARETPPVSPGLHVIAEQNPMAKATLRTNTLKIYRDDFARAMNLSKINTVTITRVPPAADGELRMGNTVLTGGETIKAGDTAMLTFISERNTTGVSSFEFRVNDSPVDVTCELHILDRMNECPTLGSSDHDYLNASTHENIALYGRLPCFDPDGDDTVIEIVSYPQSGLLILNDRQTGDYTYIPADGYTGKDEFKYVARDIYGNYSAAKTVTLTVDKPRSALVFADMKDSPSHSAAISVTEAGIMQSTQVGDEIFFCPEEKVTREEFLVMTMRALGMKEVADADKTVFYDDAQISDEAKGFIAAAYQLNYIKGEKDKNGNLCFAPKRVITRAEAACMLTNMIDAVTPTMGMSFADSEDVPTWAEASLYSLSYMGIIPSDGGNIAALDSVTRADAARILSALM